MVVVGTRRLTAKGNDEEEEEEDFTYDIEIPWIDSTEEESTFKLPTISDIQQTAVTANYNIKTNHPLSQPFREAHLHGEYRKHYLVPQKCKNNNVTCCYT